MQLGQIALIADCVAAAAEPLWYNSLLQTGRGFWDDSGEYPEATWWAWAWAGFRSVQNLLNADGTFRTSTSIPGVKAGSRKATTFDYMVNRVRRSPIGMALRRPAEPREWWLDPASSSIWHYDERWRIYRPQHLDRLWIDGTAQQATSLTVMTSGQLLCTSGDDVTVCESWQRMEMEPWTASQLNFIGYGDPHQVVQQDTTCGDHAESEQRQASSAAGQSQSAAGQAALVPCLARWQQTVECNALIGPATWLGAVSEWSAADIGNITWSSSRGKTIHGAAAVLQMVEVAWWSKELPLPHHTWQKQGGPQPFWRKTFTALAMMAVPGWLRDNAWQMLQGDVWWGADRHSWAADSGLCGFCLDAGFEVVETANHFACCKRWDGLWRAVTLTMQAAGLMPPPREWFVLYGPSAAFYRNDQYDTVIWIWAVLVSEMQQARREFWAPDRSRRSNKQLISRFRAQLLEACRSEHSAATSYRAPVGVTAGRYGRRQARSLTGWERRWRGLAQLHRRRVRWFDDPSFDEAKAERTLARYRHRRDRWVQWSRSAT